MTAPDRTTLGLSFNEAAERYDCLRPRYSAAIWDALIAHTTLQPGDRVLEIGAGTGIATRALAERGFAITALEPGPEMARIARHSLAAFPNVSVVETTFEAWTIPTQSYDLIIAATAFHWLDPETRYARCAEALHPGGHLAILEYQHVAGESPDDDAFFAAAQPCYEQFVPGTAPWTPFHTWDELPDTTEITESPWFTLVALEQMRVLVTSTRQHYLDLISTYSGSLTLDVQNRNGLFDCIGTLIDRDFGGHITKGYRHELILARRNTMSL